MWTPPKYLIVETDTLPEVFAKVVYAKQLLENGEISQEVYNKICWKNAVKLLKLDLTEKDFMI